MGSTRRRRAPSCTIDPLQGCHWLTSLVMLPLARRHLALWRARVRAFRNEKVRGSNPLSSTTNRRMKTSIRCDLHADRLCRRFLQATNARLCLECCIEQNVACDGVKPLAGTAPKPVRKLRKR